MPGANGTGPMGQGPRTGGGFGNCAPAGDVAGTQGAGRGGSPRSGGRGRCYGGGRGPRGRAGQAGAGPAWVPSTTAPEDAGTLEERLRKLEAENAELRARLDRAEASGKGR